MADTLDVLTLAEAKAAIDIAPTDTSKDTDLAGVVTAVSRRLDRAVGPIVRRTVTDELHDGGCGSLWLRYYPVVSVTSVTEYLSTTGTALTGETAGTEVEGYLPDRYSMDPSLYSGRLLRRSGGTGVRFADGIRNVKVTYLAGRYANTAAVDPLYKQAAVITLRNLWRPNEQSIVGVGEFDVPAQSFPTFGIPNAARDLLMDEWQHRPALASG